MHSNISLVVVIVPTYNRASLLKRCLRSIIEQSYRNIRILCINDGSTDDTLAVLNYFAQQDDRLVVLSQENGGVSAARNLGLDYLETASFAYDFLAFIDDDDYVDKSYIEHLVDLAKEFDADIACCQRTPSGGGNRRQDLSFDLFSSRVYNSAEAIKKFGNESQTLFGSLSAKLLARRSINGLRFNPNQIICEDFSFLVDVLSRGATLVETQYPGYFVQGGDDHISLTRGSVTNARMLSQAEAYMYGYEKLFINNDGCAHEKSFLKYRQALISYLLGLFGRYDKVQSTSTERQRLNALCGSAKYHRVLTTRHCIGARTKLLCFLYRFCRPIFRLVYVVKR